MVDVIARTTLGEVLAGLVIFGVVACAIHLGRYGVPFGTAVVADFMGLEQRSLRKRIYISIPLFAAGLVIIFCLPFEAMWSYFAWMNQTLAMVTLWMITAYLNKRGRNRWVGLLPALVMTYVCMSYVFISPLMCGMRDRAAAYLLGGALTLAILITMIFKMRRDAKKAYLNPTPDQTFEIVGDGPYNFTRVLAHTRELEAAGNVEDACNERYQAFQRLAGLLPEDEEINLEWSHRNSQSALELIRASAIDHFLINDFEMSAALLEMLLELDPEDHLEVVLRYDRNISHKS